MRTRFNKRMMIMLSLLALSSFAVGTINATDVMTGRMPTVAQQKEKIESQIKIFEGSLEKYQEQKVKREKNVVPEKQESDALLNRLNKSITETEQKITELKEKLESLE